MGRDGCGISAAGSGIVLTADGYSVALAEDVEAAQKQLAATQFDCVLTDLRIGLDPMKMSQMAIGGLMFHRGDLQAARETVARAMPWDWAIESARQPKPANGSPYWLPDLPGRASLVHRVEIADWHADAVSPAPGEVEIPEGRIVSDTGEIVWEDVPEDGRVLFDAPRHQGVIMRQGSRATSNMAVDLASRFGAVQLASLQDDEPIASSGSLLLVAARNQEFTFDWAQRPKSRDDLAADSLARIQCSGLQ